MKFLNLFFDFIQIYLLPIIMIIISIVSRYIKSTNINSSNGYSSPYAKKSQEVYDYAQEIAPKILMRYALISSFLIATFQLLLIIIPSLEYKIIYTFSNYFFVILFFFFLSVEKELRKNFNKDGKYLN